MFANSLLHADSVNLYSVLAPSVSRVLGLFHLWLPRQPRSRGVLLPLLCSMRVRETSGKGVVAHHLMRSSWVALLVVKSGLPGTSGVALKSRFSRTCWSLKSLHLWEISCGDRLQILPSRRLLEMVACIAIPCFMPGLQHPIPTGVQQSFSMLCRIWR